MEHNTSTIRYENITSKILENSRKQLGKFLSMGATKCTKEIVMTVSKITVVW